MRRHIGFLLPILVIGLVAPIAAQYSQHNTWRTYSALNNVQDLAFDGDSVVWEATTGGLVAYHLATESFEAFRNTEGLLSLNSTAVAVEPTTGDVYVGAADGSISIRHRDGSWSYSSVIATATNYPERRINGFGFYNGRAFVLTSFGGIVYNAADSTVEENFVNLGSIPRNTAVNDILFWKDSIWLATDRGITRTSITNNNLNAPNGWISVPATDSLKVLSIVEEGGNLLLGTRTKGIWRLYTESATTQEIMGGGRAYLARNADSVVAVRDFGVLRFRPDVGFIQIGVTSSLLQSVALSMNNNVVVGTEQNGLGIAKSDSIVLRIPSAPLSNNFDDLALSEDRSIWSAHSGTGVSRLANGEWSVFTPQTTGIPGMSSQTRINAGADTTVWASATGDQGGVSVFHPADTGFYIEHYDRTNSPITPYGTSVKYQIIGDAVVDAYGNTWIVNTDPDGNNAPLLIVKPAEGKVETNDFITFMAPFGLVVNRSFSELVIDDNGTKWIGGATFASSRGLLYFNDHGTLNDQTDDTWGIIRTDDGLPSAQKTVLASDPDGILWIGTPGGLVTLVNPVSVASNNQRPDIRPVRPLKDVSINAIAVDALNRKWVGTEQGIFVLNFDGTEVVERYTKENSLLVNNSVRSILTVDATGDVYIGTINGLSRISTVAVEPEKEVSRLRVCPQPFVLPSAEPLRIEGLPASATVKVLSMRGSLVREIQSPGGGVAFWDGLDENGVLAPTGIYLIAAGSGVGDETVLGKVAVIRR